MIIAVDFDGTIVDHRYPNIGLPVPGAIGWIKQFIEASAQIILWTMRSDGEYDGPMLTQAIEYMRQQGVELWAVNSNPAQSAWTNSPKVYAHIYIDDAAIGCPLRENPRSGGRPFVNWDKVGPEVMKQLVG